MAQNGPKWFKIAQNDLKMAQNGLKMAHNWPKMAPNGLKMAQNGPKWPQNGPKWKIFVFFEVLGAFRPPNSAKLFLGQPHYSALRKGKKSPQLLFFSTANGSKPPPNHFLSKSKLKKVDFWSKKWTPNYPEICYVVPGPLQRRAAAERIGAPANARQFRN